MLNFPKNLIFSLIQFIQFFKPLTEALSIIIAAFSYMVNQISINFESLFADWAWNPRLGLGWTRIWGILLHSQSAKSFQMAIDRVSK